MDDTRRAPGPPDPRTGGPLTRGAASALLERGSELLAAGEFGGAGDHFARVVGFDDPAITATALMGLGEVRYRLDEEAAAVATWQAVLRLGETPSTYAAWRNIAAARVRAGDLPGAIEAYREADRRAPREDKAEIANRLGWLAKETGNVGQARRYFARGRGDSPFLTVTLAIVALTSVISLTAIMSVDREAIYNLLQLGKPAVAAGEYWRLWSVTLVHGDLLHLLFNMYALWLAGPIVERWYGRVRFLAFYLACAAAGSAGSFVFGSDIPSVGASGAIFGLFGILLAAGRLHNPVDRQSRALVGQIGMLIVINLVFGFASGGSIDNAAHIGGLVAGLWLGALVLPTGVPTLSTLWQRPSVGSVPSRAQPGGPPPAFMATIGVGVVAIVVAAGIAVGTAERQSRIGVDEPGAARAATPVVLSLPVRSSTTRR
ncbi:MAG TPA: rhomboid family intramembrane serine protease [Candidatus Limnocylindrales bacterium]|nr:rhomboid family intramembrane serine protease [Candidatus Limnocylindrales bacterium]